MHRWGRIMGAEGPEDADVIAVDRCRQVDAADCAADGQWEFLLAAPPLKVTGAVGSPLNPLALK